MNIRFLISSQILVKVVEIFFCSPKHLAHYLSHMFLHAEPLLLPLANARRAEKSPSFQCAAWRRRVSGRWLMQHVKPCETAARCPCVSLPGGQQHRCSVPYKYFHALSPSNLANSCIFHQKWVFWDFFFFRSSRVGGCLDSCWIQASLGGMIQPELFSNSVLNRVERDLLTPEKG